MTRKRCCGLIDNFPLCHHFTPDIKENIEKVVVNVEEFEALRLKDRNGLEQQEGAERMGVSRPTFQRLLQSARNKVATALVEGRVIVIEGGSYSLKPRIFECAKCGYVWEEPHCALGGLSGADVKCPNCGSSTKRRSECSSIHKCSLEKCSSKCDGKCCRLGE